MADTKLTELLKANTFSVEAIGKQLGDLSKEIADFKNSPCPQASIPPLPPHVSGPCPQLPKPVINIEDTPLTHKTKHIEELVKATGGGGGPRSKKRFLPVGRPHTI